LGAEVVRAGTDWAEGNFEYAANSPSIASTNFNDFADVFKNFLQPFPGGGSGETLGAAIQNLSATVQTQNTATQLPEPAAFSWGILAAGGLLGRRRRNRTKIFLAARRIGC